MLLLEASATSTCAPHCGQANWRAVSSLVLSSRKPASMQLVEQHRAAACQRGGLAGVVDAQHFAIGAAQFHDREGLSQRGKLGQLALGRDQRDLLVGGDAEGLAVDRRGRADTKLRGRRNRRAAWPPAARTHRRRCPRPARPREPSVEQRVPFGPGAAGAAVLQAAHQGEGLVLPAAAGQQLQRAVVVEQLGHLADARQRVAVAHDRAAAKAAHRMGGLRAAEFDRRAAAGAGRAVEALGGSLAIRAGACHRGRTRNPRWRATMDPGSTSGMTSSF